MSDKLTSKEKLIFAIGVQYVVNFRKHTEIEMQEACLKLKSIIAPEIPNQEVIEILLPSLESMRKEMMIIMRNFDSID